ncbi:uncharacterized protein LOC144860285 [Branchiostoma floridae x Branchiostoma japonicum]
MPGRAKGKVGRGGASRYIHEGASQHPDSGPGGKEDVLVPSLVTFDKLCLDVPRERWAEELPVATSTKALHNIRRDSGPGGKEGVLVPPLVQCLDVPRERWAGEVPGVTVTEALHSIRTVVLAERKASWCLLSLWVSLEVFMSFFRRHSMTCRCLDGHRTFPRHLTSNAWTCQGKGGQRRCQSLHPRRRFTTSGETVVLAEVVLVPPLVECLDVPRERWAGEVPGVTVTEALHNIRRDSGPGGKEGVLVPPLVVGILGSLHLLLQKKFHDL